jgi:DNA adenine methylase
MIGPLSYIGGKNRLAAHIIKLLPDHTTYVEPFCGGAQVFFHKEPSEVEVLNDLDGEVVNFLRVCQWHHEELIRHLEFLVVSRHWYELMKNIQPETLTDVQRAARFFYIQKNSYGGLILKQNYHYGVVQSPNYNPNRIPEILRETHIRLKRVQLEQLPYHEILRRYDRPTTLFYLDPPYYRRKLYKFNMSDQDFEGMNERLTAIKGTWLLSIDDHPEIRRIFKQWHMQPLELAYSSQPKSGKRYQEFVISNFALKNGLSPS